jgi:hypothetical protein
MEDKRIIIGLILSIFLMSGCIEINVKNPPAEPIEVNWSRYDNLEHSFSIDYPKNWEVKEEPRPGAIVSFNENVKYGSRATFNIVINYQKKPIMNENDFDRGVNESIEHTKSLFKNYRLFSKEKVIIGGHDSWLLELEFGPTNALRRDFQAIMKCNDTKVLIVTAGSSVNTFDRYENLFKHAIYSVKC